MMSLSPKASEARREYRRQYEREYRRRWKQKLENPESEGVRAQILGTQGTAIQGIAYAARRS